MPRTRKQTVITPPNTAFTETEFEETPLEAVIREDEGQVANTVADILTSLAGLATDDAKLYVYRSSKLLGQRGKWAFLTVIHAPIDGDALLTEIQTRYGGGTFSIQVRAKGRLVTTKEITIEGEPKTPKETEETTTPANTDNGMLEMLMTLNQQSKSDMQQMMTMMIAMMQNSSTQMMQMLTAILPVIAGGRDTPASIMGAMAPFLKQNSTDDTIKMFAAIKELVGSGEGGGDSGNLWERLASTGLPLVGKILETMPQGGQPGMPMLPAPMPMPGPMGPMVMPAPTIDPTLAGHVRPASTPAGWAAPDNLNISSAPNPGEDAIATIIRQVMPDVLFFAQRGHDPGLAAEAITALIDRLGITPAHVQELVSRFALSADWITDLAGMGYDLSQYRDWANQFLTTLVTEYAASHAAPPNSGG